MSDDKRTPKEQLENYAEHMRKTMAPKPREPKPQRKVKPPPAPPASDA